jgi:hypothetical protein
MRVSVVFAIAFMCMLFVASSASAGPIFQFIGNGASNPGFYCSCPVKNFLISLDDLDGNNSSLFSLLAKGSNAHVIEPKIALAGMWLLQSEDVAALGRSGKQFEVFLIPLFAGSLLIGLSGLIKTPVKKKPLTHHEKSPVKVRVSYEKTLWAESHGLM